MDSHDLINSLIDKTSLIEFSDEEDPLVDEKTPLSHFPIIAKTICDKPNNPQIHPHQVVEFTINTQTNQIEQNTVAFLLEKEEDRTRILRNSPWCFRGNLIVLKPWLPEEALADVDLTKFQIWVQVSGLPVRL
ncbi:hypothetical protein Salat_0121600 [Sesamum alatum]|uniref:DUF4283 domain-containing protein n=1 Tax=Sesamum alatum TaxID=300844 RepID=A0AAE1YX40_9LAMI|nr:hypothetical protein Salat_0121600 [Sesamum alatum]